VLGAQRRAQPAALRYTAPRLQGSSVLYGAIVCAGKARGERRKPVSCFCRASSCVLGAQRRAQALHCRGTTSVEGCEGCCVCGIFCAVRLWVQFVLVPW
jgi:hypothetical protein